LKTLQHLSNSFQFNRLLIFILKTSAYVDLNRGLIISRNGVWMFVCFLEIFSSIFSDSKKEGRDEFGAEKVKIKRSHYRH
jgi:hypothetical protein